MFTHLLKSIVIGYFLVCLGMASWIASLSPNALTMGEITFILTFAPFYYWYFFLAISALSFLIFRALLENRAA